MATPDRLLVSAITVEWIPPVWSGAERKVAGSGTATAAWVIATLLLGIYAANFDRFDALYGSVATTVVVLVWFHLSAFAVLLGAELDAGLGEVAGAAPGATTRGASCCRTDGPAPSAGYQAWHS